MCRISAQMQNLCRCYRKKRLLLRCIRHFKSDSINNMDHIRIAGTEPSSVILSQTLVIGTDISCRRIGFRCKSVVHCKYICFQ